MSHAPRPLVVTADPDLLDDLVRVVAAAGAEADVAIDPTAARRLYGAASVVLIGSDQLVACARARLPHRPRVFAVTADSAAVERLGPIAARLGAEYVTVLPIAEHWLTNRIGQLLVTPERAPGRVVAVLGGRGGAGASTLAAGLAVTAVRQRCRTLLVDADPLGGGIDLVLGWETKAGLRWQALTEASGRVDEEALCRELPGRGDLVVLSWGRRPHPSIRAALPAAAMVATLEAGRRGRDLVVVDLPRSLDDATETALAMADHAVMVVPAEVRAAAAASQFATEILRSRETLGLVVRGPAPGRLSADEIASAMGLPLLGFLSPEPGLSAALERGQAPGGTGRGPLASLCCQLLKELS